MYQFTCLQKELNYWLVSDGSNAITRIYFNRADAETYLNSIAVTTPNGNGVRLGGAVQGIPLLPLPTSIFTNVSTVVGITQQVASPFADYSSGRTPPVVNGRPIGIVIGRPIAITKIGNTLFVLDSTSNRIQVAMLDSNGAATNVRTLGSASFPSADIIFNNPSDITNDGQNLYVTDTSNSTIDKIALTYDSTNNTYTGTLTILAGSTGSSGAIDGTGNTPATATVAAAVGTARFVAPIGITCDGTNLYVTDDQAIRKIDLGSPTVTPLATPQATPQVTVQVTTLAGYPGFAGTADAVGFAARFNLPLHITTDGNNLYVTDNYSCTIRKVAIATGQVTTIAGTVGVFGTNNPTDPNDNPTVLTGDAAHFNGPNGITTDGTNLYVTDWGPVIYGSPARGQVIFSIVLANPNPKSQYSGPVTRVAGTQNTIGSNSGPLAAGESPGSFDCPIGITTDGTSLYVADSLNFTIRRIK